MVQLNGIMAAYLAQNGYRSRDGCGGDLGDSMGDLSEDLDGKEIVDEESFDRDLVDQVLAGSKRAQDILVKKGTPSDQSPFGLECPKYTANN